MSIPTDRLREIADGAMGIGAPLVLTQAEQVEVCTELLALRDATSLPGYTRLVDERDAARAEAEKLRTELDEAVNAELAHKAKWESICSASRENGTCACSYDSIDDVCMAHSPKLAAAMADLAAARAEAEHERRAGQEMTAGLHEKLAEVRAELAAERERFNLLSQRCDAAERERDAARIRGDDLAGRLAVAIVWRRSLARACNDFIEAFDEHGVYDGLFYGSDSWLSALRAEVRSAQPTKSEVIAERDAARAEAEKLRKALIACGREAGGGLADDVSTDFLMHVPEEVRMRLAAVKRQRDELLRAAKAWQSVFGDADGSEPVVIDLRNAAVFDLFTAFVDTLAAEQPKPQQPEGGA